MMDSSYALMPFLNRLNNIWNVAQCVTVKGGTFYCYTPISAVSETRTNQPFTDDELNLSPEAGPGVGWGG